MSRRARVLVIGGGPAGLAAAARLLERGQGRVAVKLVHQGHHLGGKAASYRVVEDGTDQAVEHGWHMILGFYTNLLGLMRRAGVDLETSLISMGGVSNVFESWNQKLNRLESGGGRVGFAWRFLSYEGLPFSDRMNWARFMAQAFLRALGGEDLTRHDDVCFSTWAVEHGLRPHQVGYSLFRLFREGFFNFPEEISAYHVLKTFQLMSSSEDAEVFVLDGPYSERVWDPIGRYITSLGGEIEPYVLARGFDYEGRRVTGVRVARPDSSGHRDGLAPWAGTAIPHAPGTERVIDGFDAVISTIPQAVFVKMNPEDRRMWASPYFARLKNLRSAATISLTVLTKEPVMPGIEGPLHGFPAPLGVVTDMKRYWSEYRDDQAIGSALVFVGQEAGFESWSDAQIVEHTLDNLSRAKEIADVRAAGIVRTEIHRNRSDHERLFLCEPGVERFRPGPKTPFTNLFLAGDWVRNPIGLICMEGAVTSGFEAADLALAGLLSDPVPVPLPVPVTNPRSGRRPCEPGPGPEPGPAPGPGGAPPPAIGRRAVTGLLLALPVLGAAAGCATPRLACRPEPASAHACRHRFCRYAKTNS